MNRAILDLLAAGAEVVTPNRRLARALSRAFDAQQRASGRIAWPTPSILPYQAWLTTLWEGCVAAGAIDDRSVLLTPPQSILLWERIVDDDRGALLNPRGAAALAAEAWSLLHAWGAGGESWRAWRRDDQGPDDAAMFAKWADRYAAELRRLDMVDPARLPDVLASLAPRVGVVAPLAVTVLAGFVDLTPQQDRVFAAMGGVGAVLRRLDTLAPVAPKVRRAIERSPRAEIAAALAWAGARIGDGQARVGIVVENLAARRNEVIALAEDILAPGSILPGAPSTAQVFDVSLGASLASFPLVATALNLIALGESSLAAGDAAALLRSPYLPGAETAAAGRAAVERDWMAAGYREVTLAHAIAALDRRSPDLAARWREASLTLMRERTASPRLWSDAWRAWLDRAGWPGARPLDTGEYQAREAWERLLLQFSSLGAVAPRMDRSAAVEKLRAMARETIFQPEGSVAPIQILGVLEASGLAFDALWVAGLSSERWPPAPSPNPLLPIAWQREHGIPRAQSSGELAFARALTESFAAAASEVVFSSASSVDDRPTSSSTLISGYPELPWSAPAQTWSRTIAVGRQLESITDDHAPPLLPGSRAPGGSRIIASQSDCPFQAAARHRLGAEPWPVPLGGLSPQERGALVHLAMAAFWTAACDHATLIALDEEKETRWVRSAVEKALSQFSPVRWRGLPVLVRGAEAARLQRLLRAWLVVEKSRPPFAVEGIEAEGNVELASLNFGVRLDRLDALADGGIAIVDFKTGAAESPAQWFAPRPRATQLGMYVLTQRDARPDVTVRAAAYAQLRSDAVTAVGIAADPAAWPGLSAVSSFAVDDWSSLEAWWRARLGELAAEIAAGNALVDPREKPLACRTCCLQPLCRIQSARNLAEQSLDDE